MKIRKSVAAAALAGAAVFSIAACSSSDDTSSTTTAASSVATSAAESTAADSGTATAPADLDAAAAQTILRTAVNPDTTSDELDKVVDTSSPATKPALQGYAKGAAAAGYGPEVYEVKSVAADGEDKAAATVAVTSPHAPDSPVDVTLTYVKVDGTWKLSGDAVTQLTGFMGGSHGS